MHSTAVLLDALGLGDVADGALVACRGGLEVTVVNEAAGGADVVAVHSSGVQRTCG